MTATVADLVSILTPCDQPAAEPRDAPDVQVLVQAARQGRRDAFGELVRLYQQVALRTALAALGRREDAEDVVQEAFLVAWRKLSGFRGDARFRTWLLTIVWRKALDRRRRRRLWWHEASAARPGDHALDRLDALAATEPDPEHRAVVSDLARRTAQAIGALSPKLRDTLLLAASGEHSYAEVARVLGVPVGTVKWRVVEARRKVAAALDATPGAATVRR